MYVTHLAAVEKLRDRPEQGTGSPMVGERDIYIYIYIYTYIYIYRVCIVKRSLVEKLPSYGVLT